MNIQYSAEDDLTIEQYIRENVTMIWHLLGTAEMAPVETLGIVDPDLNVYGVQALKVIDLSIAPKNVGANTNNTAVAIGETGADNILKEGTGVTLNIDQITIITTSIFGVSNSSKGSGGGLCFAASKEYNSFFQLNFSSRPQ